MFRIMTGLANRVEQLEASESAQNLEVARLRAAITTLSSTQSGQQATSAGRAPSGATSGLLAPASPVKVGFSPTSPYSNYIPLPPPLTRANTFNDFSTSPTANTPLNTTFVDCGAPQPSPGLGDRYGGSDPFDFAASGAINAGPGMGFFPGGMLSASPGTTNPRRSRIRSASEGLQLQPHRPRGASFSTIAPIVAQAKWMAQQQLVVASGPLGLPGPVPPPEQINYRALVEHDLEIDADVSLNERFVVVSLLLIPSDPSAVVCPANPDAQRPAVLDVPPAAAQDDPARGAQDGHHPGGREDAPGFVLEQVWQLPRVAVPGARRARAGRQLGQSARGTSARALA